MKKITVALLAITINCIATINAWAKYKATCTVKAMQEQNVILDCGEKVTKLKIDDLVEITRKTVKTDQPIEGC